jgi:hypothetical protein
MDEVARVVAAAAVPERVVTAVAPILELLAQHPRHPLGVEVALELVREGELPEEVAPVRSVEGRRRNCRHEQPDLVALELVVQLEHELRIPRQPREVVDGDVRDLASLDRLAQRAVAVTVRAGPGLVAA